MQAHHTQTTPQPANGLQALGAFLASVDWATVYRTVSRVYAALILCLMIFTADQYIKQYGFSGFVMLPSLMVAGSLFFMATTFDGAMLLTLNAGITLAWLAF